MPRMPGLVALSLATSALTSVAYAQAAPSGPPKASPPEASASAPVGLEEVVVTARQQSESLVMVPVAVSALSPADIQRNHATDLQTIAELTPQVIIQRSSSGNGAIFAIRGIGSTYLDAGLEQSVLVYIDNVPVSRGRIANAGQFDIGEVQVLKGPQALFFGKNASAGVISISSAAPTDTLSGYVRGGYEVDAAEKFVEAAVSGPLTDTLKARLAGRYDYMDGWLTKAATGYALGADPLLPGLAVPAPASSTQPKGHSIAGRLTLDWKPVSNFDATLKIQAADETVNGEGAYSEEYCVGGQQFPQVYNPLIGPGTLYTDFQNPCGKVNGVSGLGQFPAILASNWPGANGGVDYSDARSILGSLDLNWNVGDLTLTSITGYSNLHDDSSANGGATSFANVYFTNFDHTAVVSQELRVVSHFHGPLNFSAGGYFEDSERNFENGAFLGYVGVDPATGKYYTFDVNYHTHGTTYSGFAQLRWQVIPQVEIAGGARYTHEEKDMVGGNLYTNPILGPAFGLEPAGMTINPTFRGDNVSPEATISYHPTEESTLYVAYKTGYKSGGFSNTSTFSTTNYSDPSTLAFGPEKAHGFEGGWKGELLDRTLRADLTAYSYTFDGLQLSVFNPTTVSFLIKNAAVARTTGVEANVNWRATRDLTLRASGSYNDAKYVSFPNASCYTGQTVAEGCLPVPGGGSVQNRSGETLPRAPKWTFSTGYTYDTPVTSKWMVGFTGDVIYTDKYSVIDDGDPRINQTAFWRVNASVRLYDDDDHLEFSVVGRNLTNNFYKIAYNDIVFGQLQGGEVGGVSGRPREIVLQVQYKF